jgi:hypothetical protein
MPQCTPTQHNSEKQAHGKKKKKKKTKAKLKSETINMILLYKIEINKDIRKIKNYCHVPVISINGFSRVILRPAIRGITVVPRTSLGSLWWMSSRCRDFSSGIISVFHLFLSIHFIQCGINCQRTIVLCLCHDGGKKNSN